MLSEDLDIFDRFPNVEVVRSSFGEFALLEDCVVQWSNEGKFWHATYWSLIDSAADRVIQWEGRNSTTPTELADILRVFGWVLAKAKWPCENLNAWRHYSPEKVHHSIAEAIKSTVYYMTKNKNFHLGFDEANRRAKQMANLPVGELARLVRLDWGTSLLSDILLKYFRPNCVMCDEGLILDAVMP